MGKASKLILLGIVAVPGVLVLSVVCAAIGAMVAVFFLVSEVANVLGGP